MYRPLHIAALALLLSVGCGGDDEPPLTPDELMTAEACERCHPDHYEQWIGSSHAYAADDPVFVAMNARFQRDTGGQYPQECIRCHAPVALAEGATTDGTNLADVPSHLKGVTCFACHVVADASPSRHTFVLADDGVMRGGVKSPVSTGAHESEYSTMLAREEWQSTDLCGACHEIENRAGVAVHRTYTEWTSSLFADTAQRLFLTCNGCHMAGEPAPIATDGPDRRLHDHSLVGVNVALLDWPGKEDQRARIEADLGPTVQARVCLDTDLRPEIILDNVMGGHMWPSGDASTRRAWVEVVVRDGGEVIYQSGVVPAGDPVTSIIESDPDLWLLWDRLEDGDGQRVTFPWEAEDLEPNLLPPSVTADPSDPRYYHAVSKIYPALPVEPDSISLKVHLRPIGLDIIDELVDGGDLAPGVRDLIPTFVPEGTVVEWQGMRGTCEPPLNP